ncbi:MAG: glyoxalase/bleomycin resistance/extradiol dioxygenase family protein [Acidimicrobiales bacterium]|nr:glyoxalase/bleomycin resistance/extradiol dioxygenase family protein [Acidimicrobiales bacterium]RZV43342.1 MAG: glyoxalase/bleomycin resistance/extradiol dioxygenase family protein [Acidimicrobiales bacterium]
MRLQLAMNVSDLDESIDFYTKMFDTPPAKIKPGYANFAIENPPLKLVLFEGEGDGGTINHLGVEVETSAQVIEAEQRIAQAGIETTGVDDTMCCYADKTETWVNAPDNRWEWYVKKGDNEQFKNIQLGDGDSSCCVAPVAEAAEATEAQAACC